MAFRVASSATTRIEIAKFQEWIEVKEELSVGEMNAVTKAGVLTGNFTTDDLGVDLQGARIEKVVQYLVEWSMTEGDGDKAKPITLRGKSDAEKRTILRSLDTESFNAIAEAIDAHAKAVDAKKTSAAK